jgi:hypothetical protein
MNWMKAGHSGDFHFSIQPGPMRSDGLVAPGVQGSAQQEIVPVLEQRLQNSAQDGRLPIPIHREGLLG